MKPRAILLTIVAFLLGALAAGSIGVRVIREVGTAEGATSLPDQSSSTTTEAPVQPTYQIDPFESVISSTSLIPIGVTFVDTEFAIEYDLVTLVPHEGVDPFTYIQGFGDTITIEPGDFDHIWPRTWIIETEDDAFEGGAANLSARVARIEVDEGFSPSDIQSVRIVEALAPFRVEAPLTLSASEPRSEVYPGVTVELKGISDQGSSSIVLVEVERDDPETTFFFVNGDGPGWRSAVWQAEGGSVVNLTWVGGELPDEIPLVAVGSVLIPVDGPFEVTLEGLS